MNIEQTRRLWKRYNPSDEADINVHMIVASRVGYLLDEVDMLTNQVKLLTSIIDDDERRRHPMKNQPLNLANVTKEQLGKMRHALGLNKKKKPNRNYFNCSANDPHWCDLVEKGFATKRGAWTSDTANFVVTFEATKLLYGKPISKKYYDHL